MNTQGGYFVISLDFELYWGVRDKLPAASYRENILGARQAVPKILDLFTRYNIHSTWAVVGFMFFSNKKELYSGLPKLLPIYHDKNLSPYPYLEHIGENEQSDPMHYAPSLIKRIASCQGQEVASHTFSHYYCLEPGQSEDTFRADLAAACAAAQALGVGLRSLVFPRNQCNEHYLEICRELGITAYRGNERAWMYRASNDAAQHLPRRLARYCDTHINLSGHHCTDVTQWRGDVPVNLPASRFLRPVSNGPALLEQLRLRRIKSDMLQAATHGLLYHLWWHPHNFGINTEENIRFLNEILNYYRYLNETHGMRSLNMSELAEEIIARGSETGFRDSA